MRRLIEQVMLVAGFAFLVAIAMGQVSAKAEWML